MTTHALAGALSPHPHKWLFQLRIALRPKPATIARIEALIAGEEIPLAPPNNFQAKPGGSASARYVAERYRPREEELPPPVFRDPCPRCGVRADIGCPHSHARISMGAFA